MTRPPVPRKYAITLTQTNDTLYQEAANTSNSTPPTTPDPINDAPAQPTEYYKALDSALEDLFNTTDDVNAAGTNLDPRWKLMVGPPINETSGLDPSACVYIVTSEIGVTTSFYTIQPTVATMCWCDGSVIAGIQTVTASSTSYLVCAVPSSITVSTLGAATTTQSPSPPLTTSPPTMSSAACEVCENDLGDSSCAPSDLTCLSNQCENDENCQTCGIDCSTDGIS